MYLICSHKDETAIQIPGKLASRSDVLFKYSYSPSPSMYRGINHGSVGADSFYGKGRRLVEQQGANQSPIREVTRKRILVAQTPSQSSINRFASNNVPMPNAGPKVAEEIRRAELAKANLERVKAEAEQREEVSPSTKLVSKMRNSDGQLVKKSSEAKPKVLGKKVKDAKPEN